MCMYFDDNKVANGLYVTIKTSESTEGYTI